MFIRDPEFLFFPHPWIRILKAGVKKYRIWNSGSGSPTLLTNNIIKLIHFAKNVYFAHSNSWENAWAAGQYCLNLSDV
jgi:hypothetical protein